MTRWEYLIVSWTQRTNLESKRPEERQTWQEEWSVRAPGSERRRLPDDLKWFEYLNELGADGWELVNERHRSSVVYSATLGWPNASGPVQIIRTFRRPIAN
jgi:hypothetical protein